MPPPEQLHDTLIEVIDPSRDHVVARAREGRPLTPIGNGLFAAYSETIFGVPQIAILRLRLIQP
jgi:hypothetical protein